MTCRLSEQRCTLLMPPERPSVMLRLLSQASSSSTRRIPKDG